LLRLHGRCCFSRRDDLFAVEKRQVAEGVSDYLEPILRRCNLGCSSAACGALHGRGRGSTELMLRDLADRCLIQLELQHDRIASLSSPAAPSSWQLCVPLIAQVAYIGSSSSRSTDWPTSPG